MKHLKKGKKDKKVKETVMIFQQKYITILLEVN